jgi:dTDP-4-amino-4,6-dideoxy-D-galactose acyltransferase
MKVINVIPKDWDTENFGYKVGEIELDSTVDNSIYSALVAIEEYDYQLIYIFAEKLQEVEQILLENRTDYHEKKIILKKEVSPLLKSESELKVVSLLGRELDEQLLSLAYQSGEKSRFRLDKYFQCGEFRKLYKAWIRRSLAGEIADEIFGIEDRKKNIIGFVSIKLKGSSVEIGLIAVDEDARGKGIGKALMEEVEKFSFRENAKEILIATQGINEKAMNFYLKRNYNVEKEIDIFHFRNRKF